MSRISAKKIIESFDTLINTISLFFFIIKINLNSTKFLQSPEIFFNQSKSSSMKGRLFTNISSFEVKPIEMGFFQFPDKLTEEEETLQRKYAKLKRKVMAVTMVDDLITNDLFVEKSFTTT